MTLPVPLLLFERRYEGCALEAKFPKGRAFLVGPLTATMDIYSSQPRHHFVLPNVLLNTDLPTTAF